MTQTNLGALPEPVTATAPICKTCKGARWLRNDVPYGHPLFGKITKCPCSTGLVSNDIPSDVYTWLGDEAGVLPYKTLATFDRAAQPKAYDLAKTWLARALRDEPGLENIVFKGNPGTGKTHLVAALVNALTQSGIRCLFMVAPTFFEVYYPADFEQKLKLMSRAQSVPVLVIDDVDKMSGTAYQKDKFFEMLNARSNAGKPTLLTTNATDSLKTWFNDATISRLYGRMGEKARNDVTMNGADYRMKGGAR